MFTKSIMDLPIVDIKDQFDHESCFVGIGISGHQIAEKLSKEYYICDRNTKIVLDVIHRPDEFSELIKQILSHHQNLVLVIISGSISDPNFHSLRNIALSNSPMLLWTIIDAPDNIIEYAASIQPQANESITNSIFRAPIMLNNLSLLFKTWLITYTNPV